MISSIASALLLGGFVVGCGSSDSTAPVGSGDSGGDVTQTSIDGKAVDGYLRYSTVCLDLSQDGFCQPSEPNTLTDADGSFTLTLTDLHRAHENFATAPLLVYDGQDSDTAENFKGKLKSPNDGTASINITPLTTLVAEISGGDKAKIAEAKTKVATILGLEEADVGGDPVALAVAGNSAPLSRALEVQKAVERMVIKEEDDAVKAISASALYATLAGTINTQIALSNVSDIVESSRTAIKDVVSGADVDGAKALSILVKQAIDDTESFTADTISEVATVISATISATKNESTIDSSTALVSVSEALLTRAKAFGNKLGTDGDAILYLFSHDFGSSGSYTGPLKLSMSYAQMKDALENAESIVNPNPSSFTVTKEQVITYLDTKLAEIAEEIAAVEEAQEQAELAAKPFLAINAPFSMYEIDSWEEWDGNNTYRAYEIWQDTFENGSLTWATHEYVAGVWETNEEDLDYILKSDGTWGQQTITFTTQSDNSLMTGDGGKFGIVSSTDIAGSYTLELNSELSIDVDMPTGAKEYISKYEVGEDAYIIWGPRRDYSVPQNEPIAYFQTLNEAIEKQCGNRWFMGDEYGGYAFAPSSIQEPSETNGWQEYVCDATATSGTLYEAKQTVTSNDGFDYYETSIISTNAGTWERKTVNNQEMIVVTPYDSSKYGEEILIFAVANPDGEGDRVWEGAYDKKGSVYTWKSYNDVAIDAIKDHISNMNP